jgi:hypothetical protein
MDSKGDQIRIQIQELGRLAPVKLAARKTTQTWEQPKPNSFGLLSSKSLKTMELLLSLCFSPRLRGLRHNWWDHYNWTELLPALANSPWLEGQSLLSVWNSLKKEILHPRIVQTHLFSDVLFSQVDGIQLVYKSHLHYFFGGGHGGLSDLSRIWW